jgi:hypothetical protein
MNKFIAFLIVTLSTIATTTFAASYSTEATMTRQKDKNTYTVIVSVSRLVEQDGKLTEQLIAKPRIISSPGGPASMYQGLQSPDPDYKKVENVSVDVAWPKIGESGFALCTVTVKLGDEIVSKSKLQVVVDEK